ncbi:Cyclin-D-binding Myb-like transcription factor 1 [Acropora cervicornis]|uniref:Cyclin-D-binding Myb-like transcription factor 1 n=1 Tax=Acropora cervicornis TaxID=6130 RepID=A0AAD9QRC8_ACRCE|nr:Cyclin-D-binding Myb-like transcription factor 1 [Acropora cervicornis]
MELLYHSFMEEDDGVAYKGLFLQFTDVLSGFTTRPTIWDVHRVTDTPEGGSVPFKGFSWQAVADIVKTRNSYQCRSQWLYRLCFREDTIKSGKRWSAEDDRKLITRLYTSGVTEECDVDWMDTPWIIFTRNMEKPPEILNRRRSFANEFLFNPGFLLGTDNRCRFS